VHKMTEGDNYRRHFDGLYGAYSNRESAGFSCNVGRIFELLVVQLAVTEM